MSTHSICFLRDMKNVVFRANKILVRQVDCNNLFVCDQVIKFDNSATQINRFPQDNIVLLSERAILQSFEDYGE